MSVHHKPEGRRVGYVRRDYLPDLLAGVVGTPLAPAQESFLPKEEGGETRNAVSEAIPSGVQSLLVVVDDDRVTQSEEVSQR